MFEQKALLRKRVGRAPLLGAACFFVLSLSGPVDFAAADDSFIVGYASAVIENEYELSATVRVTNGIVTVYFSGPVRVDRRKLLSSLNKIPGVVRVELVESSRSAPQQEAGAAIVETHALPPEGRFFPRGLLFEPLHADPRWPHFSATYRSRISGTDASNPNSAFSGNFGESLAVYRHSGPFDGQWELGLQGGVFSIFDVGSPSGSQDLINADYTIAVMSSYRTGPLSALFRFNHLSTHLGDEYILNSTSPVTRLGLSYDGLDLKLSYEFFDWLRVYGGGGYLLNVAPSDLKPWTSQFGTEFTCPKTFLWDTIRPVAYADFQVNQRTDWSVGRSIMAGISLEHDRLVDRNILLLFEYYGGPSPNGDFLFQQTQWFGIGLHFYL